tara:strand:- start:5108 stop:5305 length:198 start_codon:yes stop_codon:yes gene_type:complete
MWEVWTLCFWWSTWSLADVYLLKYSPVPEVVALCICTAVAGITWARRHVRLAVDDAPVVLKEEGL